MLYWCLMLVLSCTLSRSATRQEVVYASPVGRRGALATLYASRVEPRAAPAQCLTLLAGAVFASRQPEIVAPALALGFILVPIVPCLTVPPSERSGPCRLGIRGRNSTVPCWRSRTVTAPWRTASPAPTKRCTCSPPR